VTDDPPGTVETALMNSGAIEDASKKLVDDGNPNNDGKIHVIPAAVGAVAPLVNFPNGCSPEALDDQYRTVTKAEITGDSKKKALLRVRFTKTKFEKVWAQGDAGAPMVKWSDVFPELVSGGPVPACEVAIIRVVRFDESGTSFAFKDYLKTIEPTRGWTDKYATEDTTALTRKWPGAVFGSTGQCGATSAPGKEADATDHLTSGCANGNGPLTAKLVEVDGSVGYSDISTARNNSPSLALNPNAAGAPVTPYWTQAENGSNVFTEPTANPNGFRNDGAKGANCKETEFKNVPATTLGNWAQTSGVNSSKGFGICTLTYGLVFDDNAAVWGDTPAEEAKAKTVKDYWTSIVSPSSQSGLTPADYAALPTDILAIAKAGVDQIGWKGGSGEPKTEVVVDPKPEDKKTTPVVEKPSNEFSLLRKKISSKNGGATLSVKLPGAGQLEVVGTAKAGKKQIKVGRTVLNATAAGTFELKLNPSAAAKQQLNKKGSLKVNLSLTFTPTGGDLKSKTDTVTLKLVKKKRT
jgi:ABC-type phosphate transport system substrate-binding protein